MAAVRVTTGTDKYAYFNPDQVLYWCVGNPGYTWIVFGGGVVLGVTESPEQLQELMQGVGK